MEYDIVLNHESAYALQRDVNTYIKTGWEPIGGVSVIHDYINGAYIYHQAIVRKDNKES